MTRTPWLLSIFLFLPMLSGCGGIPFFNGGESSEPAPVQEPRGTAPDTAGESTGSPGESGGAVALTPYRPATVGSPAVEELLQRARLQQEEGNSVEAVATVERALRIEPRNPRLWNRLAHLRAEQRQPVLAADLAAKSNTLAGNDPALKRDNWRLIAWARRSLGDLQGARDAESKAQSID